MTKSFTDSLPRSSRRPTRLIRTGPHFVCSNHCKARLCRLRCQQIRGELVDILSVWTILKLTFFFLPENFEDCRRQGRRRIKAIRKRSIGSVDSAVEGIITVWHRFIFSSFFPFFCENPPVSRPNPQDRWHCRRPDWTPQWRWMGPACSERGTPFQRNYKG